MTPLESMKRAILQVQPWPYAKVRPDLWLQTNGLSNEISENEFREMWADARSQYERNQLTKATPGIDGGCEK